MQFVESGNLELGTLAKVKRILSESLGEEAVCFNNFSLIMINN